MAIVATKPDSKLLQSDAELVDAELAGAELVRLFPSPARLHSSSVREPVSARTCRFFARVSKAVVFVAVYGALRANA